MHGPTILLVASVMAPIFAAPLPAPYVRHIVIPRASWLLTLMKINAPSSVTIASRDGSSVVDLFRNVLRRASIIEALPGHQPSKRAKGVQRGGKRDDVAVGDINESTTDDNDDLNVDDNDELEVDDSNEKRGQGVSRGGKRGLGVSRGGKRGQGVSRGGKRDEPAVDNSEEKRAKGVVRGGKRQPSVNESES